jgi:hypothetical protein
LINFIFRLIVDVRGYTPLLTQISSEPTAQGTASWIVLKASNQLVPLPEIAWLPSTYQTYAWDAVAHENRTKKKMTIRESFRKQRMVLPPSKKSWFFSQRVGRKGSRIRVRGGKGSCVWNHRLLVMLEVSFWVFTG